MAEHRIQLGDEFRIAAFSSAVVEMRARVLVQFDSGKLREFNVKLTTTSDRLASSETFGNIEANGRVVRAIVARISPGTIKRGQCYVILAVRDRNGKTVDQLALDYLYESNNLSLDRYQSSRSGSGFLHWFEVANDIAPVDIAQALGATNALRKVYGFVWYYHASGDVADRILRGALRDAGLTQPTGMTQGDNTRAWSSENIITLSANQEGLMYIMAPEARDGYQIVVDNGTGTVSVTGNEPIPFPLLVPEDDNAELLFSITDEEAADRHSIYILMEERIDV